MWEIANKLVSLVILILGIAAIIYEVRLIRAIEKGKDYKRTLIGNIISFVAFIIFILVYGVSVLYSFNILKTYSLMAFINRFNIGGISLVLILVGKFIAKEKKRM